MEKQIEKLIEHWDYDKAVALAKPIAEGWKQRTVEMARILYVARENLSNSGYRSDKDDSGTLLERKDNFTTSRNIALGSANTLHTWEDFCIEIGLPIRTAQDWLTCYDPDKDHLLTRQEYKVARQLELDALYEEVEKKRKTDPEYAPQEVNLKWNRKQKTWSETKFQRWLQEKNFKFAPVKQETITKDARIQEFGLWPTDWMLDLQRRCTSISSSNINLFTDYVGVYKHLLPSSVSARDFMRAVVIVEAIFNGLPPDDRMRCLGRLGMFLSQDGWRKSKAWLEALSKMEGGK